VAGSAFGLAHLSGGLVYVVLAAAAGIGYGWIYARTRSIGAAIAAHAGLNTVHFALFTYPALASAGAAAGY
jgi:membrane protease YdiL (CAAX protease family)